MVKLSYGVRSWIMRTLSDGHKPSFKRQLALFLSLVVMLAVLIGAPSETVDTICILIGGIVGVTGVEKFAKMGKR